MVLFPPPFYFVFYISNLLLYIQNNFSYELAHPIMGTIFLVSSIMNKSQEMTVFHGRQKLISAIKQWPEKLLDFKFDALYK